MLTWDDVRGLVKQLPLGSMAASDEDLREDVACIVYRVDRFDHGGGTIVNRHIDIEFAYGDYHELHDGEELFQHIWALCDLPVSTAEAEIVIYER